VSDLAARRLARAAFALVVGLLGAALWLQLATPEGPGTSKLDAAVKDIGFVLVFAVLFSVMGLLLASRRPRNTLGWLMLAVGLSAALPFDILGSYLEATGRDGAWAFALSSWTWVPVIGLSGIFTLLLFPDGHLPSPRWRSFAVIVATGMVVVSIGILFSPGSLEDLGHPELRNPFGIDALRPVLGAALVMLLTIPLGIVGAAWSLIVRFRRSGPVERLQIRWLASAAAVVAVLYGAAMAATIITDAPWESGGGTPGWVSAIQSAAILSFGLLPIAIGIAVLKYRLLAINIVVKKAVVVTTIAAFFTVVYLTIVGGVGALIQSHSTPALSFVSAAIVAALFQPVLLRARRFADRVVYGERATPYELLTEFADRLSDTYSAEDVLPRTARMLGEGIGAERARIWLDVDGELRPVATWARDDVDPDAPDDHRTDVRHQGELLGALSVAMPASDPMDPAKEKLVSDLAAQAGLLLRNVRLVEELRASARRLVSAQDQERRRLERNIHDGAQQQLVALAVKARLAHSVMERDPAKVGEILMQIESDTQQALEDLRDLARGIYPPLLADKGLPAALEAQVLRAATTIELTTDGLARYPQEVEAAVYFSVLEALQNAAKYADASRVRVALEAQDEALRFRVADDGRGFDPDARRYGTGLQGIVDRLTALGGSLNVESAPGAGTTISGIVPARPGPSASTAEPAESSRPVGVEAVAP
jgi:signal transduction histidine kinase